LRPGVPGGVRGEEAGDHRTPDGPGDDHHPHHPVGPAPPRRSRERRLMARLAKQDWQARRYAETAHFVPTLGTPVLDLLAPRPGERILDLGCGEGMLTEKIAAAGAAVVAVDAGPDMVAAAK